MFTLQLLYRYSINLRPEHQALVDKPSAYGGRIKYGFSEVTGDVSSLWVSLSYPLAVTSFERQLKPKKG